jgi:hypothetical protein
LIAPNAIVDDAVVRFSRYLGLDDSDRAALEHRLAERTGVDPSTLTLHSLTCHRDSALLVVHDHDDHEVPFSQGAQHAAAWPNAQLRETHELGHRRILRDGDVIAATVAFAREGMPAPTSDLVREVDRWFDGARP